MTVPLDAFPAYYDSNGKPLSGGKLYTYEAGTTTPLPTYTDRDGATPNANPVVLDAAGRARVWLATNTPYKLLLQDAGGVTISTVDNYYGGADPQQIQEAGGVPSMGGTFTGPVGFAGGANFGGTEAQNSDTRDSLGALGRQNLWINPNFAIWQRLQGSVTDGNYGFDRTINICDGGGVNLSQLSQPVDGIAFAMRMTQPDVTPKRIGCVQIVETRNCLQYRGRTMQLSARVRSAASGIIRAALVMWSGAGDSAPRDPIANWSSTVYAPGSFFIPFTVTVGVTGKAVIANQWTDVTVSSASPGGTTVVPPSMNNLYLIVWTDSPLGQFGTLDVSVMNATEGINKQAYVEPDSALELLRCQRYFSKSYNLFTAPGTNTGADGGIEDTGGTGGARTSMITRVVFPTNARSLAPAVSLYDVGGGMNTITVYNPGQLNGQGFTGPYNLSERGFSIATLTSNPERMCFHWTQSSEI